MKKTIIINMLVTGLLAGAGTSGIVYWLTKSDNEATWCKTEIKNFNSKDYKAKDVSMLINECKDEVLEYRLFENIIYDRDSTLEERTKLGIVFNELYIDGVVDASYISNISKSKLSNSIKNPNYSYDKKTNLQPLDEQINKFLDFTKEIEFKSYTEEQIQNYFSIFTIIFAHETLVEQYGILPKFNHFTDNKQTIIRDIKLHSVYKKFMTLMDKVKGKTPFKKISTKVKGPIYTSQILLFNSYLYGNKQKELVQELTSLLNSLKDKQLQYPNWHMYNSMLIQLILLELKENYTLSNDELKNIMLTYVKNIRYIFIPIDSSTEQLIYNLFKGNFYSGSKKENFNKLFLTLDANNNLLDKFSDKFLRYLAINDNIELLNTLFDRYKDNNHFSRKIFHSILLSYQYDNAWYSVDEKKIIEQINSLKQLELKSLYLRDALILKKADVVELAVKFIMEHKDFYIKELNKTTYHGSDYYLFSIFAALERSNTAWVARQKDLRGKRIKLLLYFIENIQHQDNKLNLLKSALHIVHEDDILFIHNINQVVEKEQDRELEMKMRKAMSKIKPKSDL
jgi:hypothetical protein